jgi:hypothetical protein
MKIEKLQPRSFQINSLLIQVGDAISILRVLQGIDYHIRLDAEMMKHLTGKAIDKTAGRNQLSLRDGK